MSGTTPGAGRSRRGITRAAALLAAAGTALALAAPAVLAAKEVPFLAARVNDQAGIVSQAVRESLETTLQDLERRSGAQVAVLTVDSLEGDTIEDFAVRVFQTWKLGRRGVDDGALFVVARQERRMRIEVGYGLEERLTDARSRQILDDHVRPHFRDGDFGAGIQTGVDAIVKTIEGAPLPPPRRAASTRLPILPLIVVGAMFILVIGTFSLVALLAPGGAGWFLYLFLVPFYGAFPTAMFPPYGGLIAAGAWLILFPIVRALLHTPQGKEFRKRHGWVSSPSSGVRWWTGGGGFSGGGSSGGGGFSGGGGRSGGGGASSSW